MNRLQTKWLKMEFHFPYFGASGYWTHLRIMIGFNADTIPVQCPSLLAVHQNPSQFSTIKMHKIPRGLLPTRHHQPHQFRRIKSVAAMAIHPQSACLPATVNHRRRCDIITFVHPSRSSVSPTITRFIAGFGAQLLPTNTWRCVVDS